MSDQPIRPKLSPEQRERLVQEWQDLVFHSCDQKSQQTLAQCSRELREAWLAFIYEFSKAIGVVWVLDRLERALRSRK